jgi:FtsZ-binding cell division protein ZapB
MALDMNAIIAILTGAAGVAGGFVGGRRFGHSQAAQISVDTVELLQIAVAELRTQVSEKDGLVTDLRARVEILESLVTQRAEVELVYEEVKGVRGVVDRIASKVGA